MNVYSPMQGQIVYCSIVLPLKCNNCNSATLFEWGWEAVLHCTNSTCNSKFWTTCTCHKEKGDARIVLKNGECNSCKEFIEIGPEVSK